MKKLLFIALLFISVASFAQRTGVYDKSIHATELLETDADSVVVQDTSTYPLDMAYLEFSSDGVTFRKNYLANDTWMRYSGFSKTSWDTIRIALNLWIVDGDSSIVNNPAFSKLVQIDTTGIDSSLFSLWVNGNASADYYFFGDDSITHTNIYNGGEGADGYVLVYRGDTARFEPAGSGVGETNIASNVNSRGVGVFEQKLDTLLEFRGVASLTPLLTVNLASEDSTIDLDLVLKTITAGIGLTGGGSMENDVTISLYFPELLEQTSLSTIEKSNDWVAIYDQSAGVHKKIHPYFFHPDVYVNRILDAENPNLLDFSEGDGIDIIGDGAGSVQIEAEPIVLRTDGTTRVTRVDTIDIVAGDNITVDYSDNGVITIASTGGSGSLPICDEGQFLAYIGGEWTCVNVCDYICADTIIDIVNNYNDTVPSVITPSGDVQINFSRLDCEDSTQILASQLATSTLNLNTIKITSIPTVGELHYNGVAVIADQELTVTLGGLDTALYYVSDVSTGSAYVDGFNFQLLYSSNASYLGEANVNVSVDACVTDAVCFGYLYNWYAVDDSRELTSSADWTVSSYSQLSDLRTYAGGQSDAGVKLKSTSSLFWDNTTGHTNELGLTLLGSGYRSDIDGVFTNIKTSVIIAGDNGTKWQGFSIAGGNASMSIGVWEAASGIPIRLTKDATGIPDGTTTTYTGNDGKVYNAVCINELYWTTENLEETQYRNGDYIPNVEDNTTWANLTTGALCLYDNDLNNACKTPLPEDLKMEYVVTSNFPDSAVMSMFSIDNYYPAYASNLTSTESWTKVWYGDTDDRHVVTNWNDGTLYYSDNGIDWVACSGSATPTPAIFEHNGVWVTGESYSNDGITWTASTNGASYDFVDILWNGSEFISIGGTNSGWILSSTDGQTWTEEREVTFLYYTYSIAYNGTTYVAGGGGGNRMQYSTDLSTWTNVTSVFNGGSGYVYSIDYHDGVFVAGGKDSGGNTLYYSTDGSIWNNISAEVSGLTVCYDVRWIGNEWVAIGNSATNMIYTSSDGINWTGTNTDSGTLYHIANKRGY